MKKLMYMLVFLFTLSTVFTGCRDKKMDDADDVEDVIEDTADDVADDVEDISDDIADDIEDAGDAID